MRGLSSGSQLGFMVDPLVAMIFLLMAMLMVNQSVVQGEKIANSGEEQTKRRVLRYDGSLFDKDGSLVQCDSDLYQTSDITLCIDVEAIVQAGLYPKLKEVEKCLRRNSKSLLRAESTQCR